MQDEATTIVAITCRMLYAYQRHEFPLPGKGDPASHWPRVSYAAFRREQGRANLGDYYVYIRTEAEFQQDIELDRWLAMDGYQIHRHADIWQFYRAIGYNYTQKSYVSREAWSKA